MTIAQRVYDEMKKCKAEGKRIKASRIAEKIDVGYDRVNEDDGSLAFFYFTDGSVLGTAPRRRPYSFWVVTRSGAEAQVQHNGL